MFHPRRQTGLAVASMMVFLALAAASAASRIIVQTQSSVGRDAAEVRSLARAKAALIGYAVSYAQQHATGVGPGYLPCPDVDNDGSPDTACGRAAIGRLPWRRLGIPDMRDAAGERLWYVLADEWRNNPYKYRPLNVDTPGSLTLNGRGDYVAIVFAPGASHGWQDRVAGPNDPKQYLDGGNRAAGVFVSGSPATNDRAIGITRGELTQAVQRRVLKEVQGVLATRQTAPWLRARGSLSTATDSAQGKPGVRHGRLPVHVFHKPFQSGFTARWVLNGMDIQRGGSLSRDLSLDAVNVRPANGACWWSEALAVECTGTAVEVSQGVRREYTLDLAFRGDTYQVRSASAADVRRRDVVRRGAFSNGARWTVSVRETNHATGQLIGWADMMLTPSAVGTHEVTGIRYALDVPNELPRWFVENEWHELLVVGIGRGFVPGRQPAANCAHVPDCIAIAAHAGLRLSPLVVAAPGPPLGSRSALAPGSGFEGSNAVPGDLFERRAVSEVFNDDVLPVK